MQSHKDELIVKKAEPKPVVKRPPAGHGHGHSHGAKQETEPILEQ